MLFADNIVLVDETKEGVNAKLEMMKTRIKVTRFHIKSEQYRVWIIILVQTR